MELMSIIIKMNGVRYDELLYLTACPTGKKLMFVYPTVQTTSQLYQLPVLKIIYNNIMRL